jgi:hypothetical protein
MWELTGLQPYIQFVAEIHLSPTNELTAFQLRHQNCGERINFGEGVTDLLKSKVEA